MAVRELESGGRPVGGLFHSIFVVRRDRQNIQSRSKHQEAQAFFFVPGGGRIIKPRRTDFA
jgi:hypothetical protein